MTNERERERERDIRKYLLTQDHTPQVIKLHVIKLIVVQWMMMVMSGYLTPSHLATTCMW